MEIRNAIAAMALSLAAWATGAGAQGLLPKSVSPRQAEASSPPPGAPKSDQEWEAWIKANLDTKGWIYVGHTADAASFVPDEVDLSPVFDLPLRIEFLEPHGRDGEQKSLSMGAIVEVSCPTARLRWTYTGLYAPRGLQGEPFAGQPLLEKWARLDPKNLLHSYVIKVCAMALSSPWTSVEEGPVLLAQKDLDAWAAKTVAPGKDAFAFYNEFGAHYVVDGAFKRTPSGGFLLTSRLELFEPSDRARSQVVPLELDCAGKRLRASDITAYPEHNLQGAARSIVLKGDWKAPKTLEEAHELLRLCDMAKAAGG